MGQRYHSLVYLLSHFGDSLRHSSGDRFLFAILEFARMDSRIGFDYMELSWHNNSAGEQVYDNYVLDCAAYTQYLNSAVDMMGASLYNQDYSEDFWVEGNRLYMPPIHWVPGA